VRLRASLFLAVTVTMLGASAEYQQAQGGVMNLVNKSGTNQFRGDGRFYVRADMITIDYSKRGGR
jgi:hypothetical protein